MKYLVDLRVIRKHADFFFHGHMIRSHEVPVKFKV